MRRYTVAVDGMPFTLDVEETAADRFRVTVEGRTFEATLERDEDLPGAAIEPGMPVTAERPALPEATRAFRAQAPYPTPAPLPRTTAGTPGLAARGAGRDIIVAPMPGVVLEVHVAPGAILERGDPVLVLEAMKMRNTIRAAGPAVVLAVEVEAGQPVGAGDPLVRLGPPPG